MDRCACRQGTHTKGLGDTGDRELRVLFLWAPCRSFFASWPVCSSHHFQSARCRLIPVTGRRFGNFGLLAGVGAGPRAAALSELDEFLTKLAVVSFLASLAVYLSV